MVKCIYTIHNNIVNKFSVWKLTQFMDRQYDLNIWFIFYNVCGPLAYTGYVDKMDQYFNNENNWIYVDPELLHECG
jgi:hypothetical protein